MRIVLTVPAFFPHGWGGGQTYVLQLARELRRQGCHAAIVSAAPRRVGERGARLVERTFDGVPVTDVIYDPASLREDERYAEIAQPVFDALGDALRRLRPQIVHANGMKAAALLAAKRCGIPAVVTAHHPGFVCPNGTLLTPQEGICRVAASVEACVPCCCASKLPGPAGRWLGRTPAALAALAGRAFGKRRSPPRAVRAILYPWSIARRLESLRVLAAAPRVICPSAAMRAVLERNGVAAERIRVIPHGLEAPARSPRKKRPPGPLRLGYLGRIETAKGLHVLLEAMARLPESVTVELHVHGEAPNPWDAVRYREAMAALPANARVVEHGAHGPGGAARALAGVDLLVLPSVSFEVFGLVVLEAFCAGVPAIVTRCGGPEELVSEEVDGLLVQRNDPEALAAAILRLTRDPRLPERLAGGIRPARSVGDHVDELRQLYEEAARGG